MAGQPESEATLGPQAGRERSPERSASITATDFPVLGGATSALRQPDFREQPIDYIPAARRVLGNRGAVRLEYRWLGKV